MFIFNALDYSITCTLCKHITVPTEKKVILKGGQQLIFGCSQCKQTQVIARVEQGTVAFTLFSDDRSSVLKMELN